MKYNLYNLYLTYNIGPNMICKIMIKYGSYNIMFGPMCDHNTFKCLHNHIKVSFLAFVTTSCFNNLKRYRMYSDNFYSFQSDWSQSDQVTIELR